MFAILVAASLAVGQQCYTLPDGRQVCPPRTVRQVAQTTPVKAQPDRWTPYAVRIFVQNGFGSGIVIAHDQGKGLVLTAGHVLTDRKTHQPYAGPITVSRRDGTKYAGTFLGAASDDDLGALEFDDPGNTNEIPVAQNMTAGETGWLVGFGEAGRLHSHTGTFQGMLSGSGNGEALFKMRIDQGDSGGPVMNRDGHLVGIANGYIGKGIQRPENPAYVTGVRQIREFLATPTCFRFFRRRPIEVNVNVTPTPSPVPAPSPVPSPVPVPAPVVVNPAPVANPFDPSALIARITALEGQVGNLTATTQSLLATAQSLEQKVAQPITFRTPGPGGLVDVPIKLGEKMLLAPYAVPNSPAPPTPAK